MGPLVGTFNYKVGPYDRYKWSYGAPIKKAEHKQVNVVNEVKYITPVKVELFHSTYNWFLGPTL